jgi:hypothetical protein
MTHYVDSNWLIIKLVLSGRQETAHRHLGRVIRRRVDAMGITDDEWSDIGGQTFRFPTVKKEADSAYTNPSIRRNETDWPTLVVECGVSESLSRLRIDARSWFAHSNGDVKIVIVISIDRANKGLLIENWSMTPAGPRPTTRAINPNTLIPTMVQQIIVTQNPVVPPAPATYTVVGAPLILGFQNLFLRPPVPPEADIIVNAALLQGWAIHTWLRN